MKTLLLFVCFLSVARQVVIYPPFSSFSIGILSLLVKINTLYFSGDFNIDMLASSAQRIKLLSLYQSYELLNAIFQPARITFRNKALLNLS